MRRQLYGILMLFFVLFLPGCTCEHQWTGADCLKPQICTQCELIGEAALGHNFSLATCTEAETCSRCGVTQGEALGHSYGEWTFCETNMTHTCSTCGHTESTELDQALYLETLLPGHWDYTGDFSSGEVVSASSNGANIMYLKFGDDRSITFKQANQAAQSGTWELVDHGEDAGVTTYIIDAVLESGTLRLVMHHTPGSSDKDLIVLYQDTFASAFSKNAQAVSLLAGNWGVAPDNWWYFADRSYWLTFREDRTVTCNIEGTFEGQWNLMPIMDDGALVGYSVYIECDDDGNTEYLTGTLRWDDITDPDTYRSLTLKHWGNATLFGPVTDEQFQAIRNSTGLLVGEWTSSLVTEELWDEAGVIKTDSSITFYADGTFTADLGQAYTGTWYVEYFSDNFSPEDGDCSYALYFDGMSEKIDSSIFVDYGEKVLYVYNSPNAEGKYTQFVQLPEGITAPVLDIGVPDKDLPVGIWTAFYHETRCLDGSGGSSEMIHTDDYTVTFHTDGTFTAQLDREIIGTWEYSSCSGFLETSGDADPSYEWEYLVNFPGEDAAQSMSISYVFDYLRMIFSVPHPEDKNLIISYYLKAQ